MFYCSSILGKSVRDEEGRRIGRVSDLEVNPGEAYPRISAVIKRSVQKRFRIPWELVKHIDHDGVICRGVDVKYDTFDSDGGLLLRRDVLDKQIVDMNGHRVVRVNDLQLNMLEGSLHLAGVDVGTPGLLRRMGLLDVSQSISKALRLKTPTNIIPWDNVQHFGPSGALKLKTTLRQLTRFHPADLADILEDLSGARRMSLFGTLDMETAAEALEYMDDDAQIALFNNLPDEKAADILEEMSPDDAADLLQDLPQDRAQALLRLMEAEEAEDVRELLEYPQDTAGGLMSPEFVWGYRDMTCQEAIDLIRRLSPVAELVYYIYVVDEEKHLLGVLSLRDVIVSNPDTILEEIMSRDLLFVRVDADIRQVVELVSKYDLLAVPVLDSDDVIKGIITFDDVIDLLLPGEGRVTMK